MATRTWFGGSAAWGVAADWSGGVGPVAGDTAVVGGGTVTLDKEDGGPLGVYDGAFVTAGAGANLVSEGAVFGHFESLVVGGRVVLESIGASGFEGSVQFLTSGGTLMLRAVQADGATPADWVLLSGAEINLTSRAILVQQGRLDVHALVEVGAGGALVANGTIGLADGALQVESGGTISGGGTVVIGRLSSFYLESGSAATSISVTFADTGGRLRLDLPSRYSGQVSNFMVGDVIDLPGVAAATATYDAVGGVVDVSNGGSLLAAIKVQSTIGSGPLAVTPDGAGGVYIGAETALARTKYTIAGADHAQGSDAVRAGMTTAAGAAITGAGVKIGIISFSFDAVPGAGTLDPANADAIAGYLPLAADGVSSAVTVLKDDPASADDEGRAMAELIHQAAPGAALLFSTGDTYADLAASVTALQQAGCAIIVDDVSYDAQPFFQVAGPVDDAVEAAVASGVSYFCGAGNLGDESFEANYAASHAAVTLYGGIATDSYVFGNGTPYQEITSVASSSNPAFLVLQWDQPIPAANVAAAQELVIRVFDLAGDLVATSTPLSLPTADGTQAFPGVGVQLPDAVPTSYQIAISSTGGTLPGIFKYLLKTSGDGTGPGGVIDDAAAQQGAGASTGQHIIPDVNSVGAMSFADTPAFGAAAGFTTYYSAVGAGDLLFDSAGHRLAAPVAAGAVGLVAPVDAATPVAGFATFGGTSAAAPEAAAVAALMLQANPALTPAQVSAILKSTALSLGLPAAEQGAGLIQAVPAVAASLAAACYAAGTKLLTPTGERAIETLRAGDLVVIVQGGAIGRVRWMGWRRENDAAAVRVRAGAFGPDMPHADVVLSPDHAVFRAGVLVPARLLVDGAGVVAERVAAVTWWHVELDAHAVVLAQGLPAESYLDTGNRAAFENAGRGWRGMAEAAREHRGCAGLEMRGIGKRTGEALLF